jgi:hypothetical protein
MHLLGLDAAEPRVAPPTARQLSGLAPYRPAKSDSPCDANSAIPEPRPTKKAR